MKDPSVVHSDPDILGGTPVFVGTRVPVQALIDYIEGARSLNEFLDDFRGHVGNVISIQQHSRSIPLRVSKQLSVPGATKIGKKAAKSRRNFA